MNNCFEVCDDRKEVIFIDERIRRADALLRERIPLGKSLKNLEEAKEKLSAIDGRDAALEELYGQITAAAKTVRTYIELIDSAVDRLDGYYAKLVRLVYCDGLTAYDICERYGWNSVNSYYYHRRLALLDFFVIWFGKEESEVE